MRSEVIEFSDRSLKMQGASLVFKGLVIVALVAALGANVACAQTSQPGEPAYGQQLRGDDQSATSQNSDDSREDNPSAQPDPDNPGAQPDQDGSAGSTDSDQNSEGNDAGSSEQENR
jgi:hypothetical protein